MDEMNRYNEYTEPTPQEPEYTEPQPLEMEVEEPKAPKEKRSSGLGGKLVALALVCSLVGGLLGAGGVLLFTKQGSQKSGSAGSATSTVQQGDRQPVVIETVEVDTNRLLSASEVYKNYVNSTVGINTSVTVNYWGYQSTAAASGSGFIISDDGYIITNYHVVEDSDSIKVTLFDGTEYQAKIVGQDAANDLAVLKVDATGLKPVVLGDSDNLHVGDPVLAIGNPLGELTFSLTSGSVSALDRSVTFSQGVTMNLIQTDCAINSGNSGGALFNMYGEVIGITNAKYSSSGSSSEASIDNIGFAIPMNSVMSQVESIIEKGYISKPYIGITVSQVSKDAQAYGIPAGAAVTEVSKDGPAEKAGLQAGDIITAIDGVKVVSGTELVNIIQRGEIGETVVLDVYRKGENIQISVVTEEHIQSTTPAQSTQPAQQQTPQQQVPASPWDFFFGN